jgi:hypothetical protein
LSTTGPDSVTRDLEDLRAGRRSAAARIVGRYWERVCGLVRPRVRWYGRPAVSADEEDIANAALNSVVMRLRQGKDPGIRDRSSLWRMLAHVAVRKAGRVVERWRLHPAARPLSAADSMAAPARSPGSQAASAEEKERLIAALRAYRPPRSESPSSEELIRLVHLLAEGRDIPEIAGRLDVARCTVYRWIDLVRKIGEQRGIARQSDESAP